MLTFNLINFSVELLAEEFLNFVELIYILKVLKKYKIRLSFL